MGYSRFYLTDLQVHSHKDKNQEYGDYHGRDGQFAADLIAAHLEAGVHVIAPTDHLSTEMWPLIYEAGQREGVRVFPGFEASIHHCHLLFIWESDERGYELATQFRDRLFGLTEELTDDSGGYRTVKKSVRDVLPEAQEVGALVIAPHSTKAKMGFFASGVVVAPEDIIREGGISGFDVHPRPVHGAVTGPQRYFGEGVVPPWLLTTDTRSFSEVGERAVYMKLGSPPTVESIKQALLAPETRVRFQEAHRDKWGRVPHLRFAESCDPSWPRIERVVVEGGLHDGLDVEFGPGLNAIIGGKGTGKSALVEMLRFALDAPEPDPKENKRLVGNLQRNLPPNASVTVHCVDSAGERWVVTRAGSDTRTPTLHRPDGSDTGVEVSSRLPVRVFGQNELRDLGDAQSLLEFLGEQAGPEYGALTGEEASLLRQLRSRAAALSQVESTIEELEEAKGELAELRLKVETAEQRGATAFIDRLRSLSLTNDALRDVIRWPEEVAAAAVALKDVLPAPEVPEGNSVPESAAPAVAALSDAVERTRTDIESAVQAAAKALEAVEEGWEATYQSARAKVQEELAKAGFTNARELTQAQERVTVLDREVGELPGQEESLAKYQAERQGLLERLWEARRARSRLVERTAERLTERVGSRFRIEVMPMADQTLVVDAASAHAGGTQRRTLERAAERAGSPLALAVAVRDGLAALEALDLTPKAAATLSAAATDAARSIEEADTPDLVSLMMQVESGSGWRPVSEVSPGERATATLAVALAGGDTPLVIDQPEDDLDNRYIYDEVVRVISNVCEGRQVTVATHNANIPVLGDAECVLAFEATSDRAAVLACGGLEEPTVAEVARHVLEGGEQAFKERHRRYTRGR